MLFELPPGKESNVVLASLGCMDDFSKVLNTESAYVVSRGLAAMDSCRERISLATDPENLLCQAMGNQCVRVR